MSLGISVVIPSWNGLRLLRENLPSVRAAARLYSLASGGPTEIIVVDDGSSDETTRRLPQEFPEVRLIVKEANEGFAKTCNVGFKACRYPLVALLNNDVAVEEEYLSRQAEHFADPRVFAVTAKVFEWDERVFSAGGRFARFRRGFWSVYFNYDVDVAKHADWIDERRLLSFYAIGGFATYDREKLRRLGGFNEMLSPFHWEDAELSYRGWKRGWEVRYEPRSVARHRISATIDSHFKKKHVDSVSLRNRLLFHWINLHSADYLARHIAMVAILFLTRFLTLDFHFYRSLTGALRRLPQALRARREEKRHSIRSDRELDRLLRDFYRSAPIRVYYNRKEILQGHPESKAGAGTS